jgi:hypothetical protein
MRCGDAVLMPAPGGTAIPHLWIVVTEPDPENSLAVIVGVTTLRRGADQTVILRRGDHPFLRHDSVVFYGDAQTADVGKMKKNIAAGTILRQQPCSRELLKLIQDGLLASEFTPQKIVRYCKRAWNRKG